MGGSNSLAADWRRPKRTDEDCARRPGCLSTGLRLQPRLDFPIRCFDQVDQCRGIDLEARPQLYVAAHLPGSFQQTGGVPQHRAAEESDVHMVFEDVHITEAGVLDASGRTAVMHQLLHIVATLAHAPKPSLRDRMQLVRFLGQPGIDLGVVFRCSIKAEDSIHRQMIDQ